MQNLVPTDIAVNLYHCDNLNGQPKAILNGAKWYIYQDKFSFNVNFFYILFYSHCLLGFTKYNEKCECDCALELVGSVHLQHQ